MIPFPHICNESCAFQKERKNWKDLKKIQDGGQEEGIGTNLKIVLQSESYRSILAIIHFYDAK